LLSSEWLAELVPSLRVEIDVFRTAVGTIRDVPLLLVQPVVWGVGAAVAGSLAAPAGGRARIIRGLLAVVAGVAVISAGTITSRALLAETVAGVDIVWAAMLSAGVAAIGVLISDGVFAPVCAPRRVEPGRGGLRVDDAEVDELLNMLATAEDALVQKHTIEAVVMITDMKSFSAMTEEEGSVGSARLVQRHRDLLLPVINARGGAGKPTGGDGLVAAFPDATPALQAAVEMQQALVAHARKHPDERAISVRIGLASGEVVVDSGGRPFIGAGLNLAARVMNLGDGGCIMATRATVDAAPGSCPAAHSHGCFELKNIATPVEVVEVLWHEGQAPAAIPGAPVPPASAGEEQE
jgi:class 3 adenylate cyclase